MHRLLLVHDQDQGVYVHLTGGFDDLDWDGRCSSPECAEWTASEGGTRFLRLDDAWQAAEIHLNVAH